jgi:staphylococcal nuclease domain-containing protein 1
VPPGGGPQFPERAVSEGTVRLRDDAGRKDESDEAARLLERLGVAEARAEADEKGVWAEAGGKVDCSYEGSRMPRHCSTRIRGKCWTVGDK